MLRVQLILSMDGYGLIPLLVSSTVAVVLRNVWGCGGGGVKHAQETKEAHVGMDIMPKHSDICRCRYVCIFKLSYLSRHICRQGTYVRATS